MTNVLFTSLAHGGEATDEPSDDLHIGRCVGGYPGGGRRSVVISGRTYPAKETLLALDRSRTNRKWNPDIKAWTANLAALNYVVRHLLDAGWHVTVDLEVASEFESYEHGGRFRPDIRAPVEA